MQPKPEHSVSCIPRILPDKPHCTAKMYDCCQKQRTLSIIRSFTHRFLLLRQRPPSPTAFRSYPDHLLSCFSDRGGNFRHDCFTHFRGVSSTYRAFRTYFNTRNSRRGLAKYSPEEGAHRPPWGRSSERLQTANLAFDIIFAKNLRASVLEPLLSRLAPFRERAIRFFVVRLEKLVTSSGIRSIFDSVNCCTRAINRTEKKEVRQSVQSTLCVRTCFSASLICFQSSDALRDRSVIASVGPVRGIDARNIRKWHNQRLLQPNGILM